MSGFKWPLSGKLAKTIFLGGIKKYLRASLVSEQR
jgi:hypothetical protein